ncbi:hypothetical protein KAU33_06805 [Candidatus Dependentiae bacterium]|nr:hypothetical protein [Candidatus Dependentiae bacterium]
MKNNLKLPVFILLFLCIFLFQGCKGKLDVKGPVIEKDQFEIIETSNYNYDKTITPPKIGPVIPFLMFGIDIYDEVFIELKRNKQWWTLEICRSRYGWFNLDAYLDGTQVLGIDNNIPEDMLKSIPIQGYKSELIVQKEITEDCKMRYLISYYSPDSEKIEIIFEHNNKSWKLKKGNGSTMGHSKKEMLALVDITRLVQGKAVVKIDGKKQKISHIIPFFLPKAFYLGQTIVGIPKSEFNSNEKQFQRLIDDRQPKNPMYCIKNPDQTISAYHFKELKGNYLELFKTELHSNHPFTYLLQILFSPAIPDLRFITEDWSGKFVMNVNNKFGYAYGDVQVQKINDNELKFTLCPKAPYWVADRYVYSKIILNETFYSVKTDIFEKDVH